MDMQKPELMISYQWDSQKDALRIFHALEEFGFNVWIDVKKMSEDIFEKMAEGIQDSSIILICMTSKYEKSANCKREFKFAAYKNKKVIPIYLEKNYKAEGALGLLIAGKLYFDFTDNKKFEKNIGDLKTEIEKQLGSQGI